MAPPRSTSPAPQSQGAPLSTSSHPAPAGVWPPSHEGGCLFAITLVHAPLHHAPSCAPDEHPLLLFSTPALDNVDISHVLGEALGVACPQAMTAHIAIGAVCRPLSPAAPEAGRSRLETSGGRSGRDPGAAAGPVAAAGSAGTSPSGHVPSSCGWQEAGGVWAELGEPCVAAGLREPQEVRLGGVPAAGGRAVDAVVSAWRGGQQVVERRHAAADGSGRGLRLALPPGLDVGPVDILLVAAAAGQQDALLAAATTMALPPAPRQELCAAAAPLPDDPPGLCVSFQQMTTDMAAVWNLLHAERCGGLGAEGSGSAAAAVLGWLLQYAEETELRATHEFLRGLLPTSGPAGGAGEPPAGTDGLPGADGGAGGPAGHTGSRPTAAAAVASSAGVAAVGQAPARGPEWLAAVAASADAAGARHAGWALAAAEPAQASLGVPAAAHPSSRAGGAHARQAPSAGSGSAGLGSSATPDLPPLPASACCGAGRPCDGHGYLAWQRQQGRGADLAACLFLPLAWGILLLKLVASGSPWHRIRQSVPMACIQSALSAAALLPLALGPGHLRRHRGTVVAAMSVGRALLFLAAAACWVVFPKELQQSAAQFGPMLLSFGVLLPAVERVGWAQQLVTNLLLEQLPQYVMLRSPACGSDMSPAAQRRTQPSLLHVLAIPVAAAATAWIMEQRSRAVFQRLILVPHGPARSVPAGSKLKVH